MNKPKKILALIVILLPLFFLFKSGYSQDSGLPLSYYDIIEKRNFFKPIQDEPPEAAAAAPEASAGNKHLGQKYSQSSAQVNNLVLSGIIYIDGRYKAIIEKQGGGEGFYVGAGDKLEDYTVVSISENSVKLERNEQEFILNLNISVAPDELKLQQEAPSGPKASLDNTEDETNLMLNTNVLQRLRTGGR